MLSYATVHVNVTGSIDHLRYAFFPVILYVKRMLELFYVEMFRDMLKQSEQFERHGY